MLCERPSTVLTQERVSQGRQPHLSSSHEPSPHPFTAGHCPNTEFSKANSLKQRRQHSTPNGELTEYLTHKEAEVFHYLLSGSPKAHTPSVGQMDLKLAADFNPQLHYRLRESLGLQPMARQLQGVRARQDGRGSEKP